MDTECLAVDHLPAWVVTHLEFWMKRDEPLLVAADPPDEATLPAARLLLPRGRDSLCPSAAAW